MGLSRCARGDFVVRLQGSLRTDPAPLGVFWRSTGSVLRSLRRLWGGLGFRAVREGFCCSPPRLASDRSRSAWRILGTLRGIGPALAEEALGRIGLSRCARGVLLFASKARFGPIPLRLAYGALRGTGPVLAGNVGARLGFRAGARGEMGGMARGTGFAEVPFLERWIWRSVIGIPTAGPGFRGRGGCLCRRRWGRAWSGVGEPDDCGRRGPAGREPAGAR
jgi:hypothetical protein